MSAAHHPAPALVLGRRRVGYPQRSIWHFGMQDRELKLIKYDIRKDLQRA